MLPTSIMVLPYQPKAGDSDAAALGCSACFPHACDCDDAQQHTTPQTKSTAQQHASSGKQSPRAAAMHEASALGVPSLHALKPKQASVAAAQLRRRHSQVAPQDDSLATAGAPPSAAQPALPPCARCTQPMPSPRHTTVQSNAANSCRFCRVLTTEQLAEHKTLENGLWICIQGRVYDVTAWAPLHPGGVLPLLGTAGADCSDVFRVFHSEELAAKRLPAFQIGVMGRFDEHTGKLVDNGAEWQETPMQKDFHAMDRALEAAGLYRTNYVWYVRKALWLLSLFAGAIYLALAAASSGYQSIYIATSSFLLGLFWQQIAFVGHDLGHNSVRGSMNRDWSCGLLVTMLFGVSVQWWKRSHNVHHVVTNSLEHDCDIQYLPVFALSEKQLRPEGFFSTYHSRLFKFDWLASRLVRWQHVLYWPVMGIARFNLYVQSIALVWDESKMVPHRSAEKFALVLFWCWHLLLLWSLPCMWTRIAYYILSHHVAGLTHVQITLSHFAMPVHEDHYSASSAPAKREHFLRSQFLTTMDVDCSTWMDWLHGGLQFQLTHHLLPRVPRHNLREVRERFVKPFALRHGLDYQEQSFWEANKTVYHRMRTAAMAAKDVKTVSPFANSILGQFLRSEG